MLRGLLNLLLGLASALLGRRRGTPAAGAVVPSQLPVGEPKPSSPPPDAASPTAHDDPPGVFQQDPDDNATRADRWPPRDGEANDFAPGNDGANSFGDASSSSTPAILASDTDTEATRDAALASPPISVPAVSPIDVQASQADPGAGDAEYAASSEPATQATAPLILEGEPDPQTEPAQPTLESEAELAGAIGVPETALELAAAGAGGEEVKGGRESPSSGPQEVQVADAHNGPEAGIALPPSGGVENPPENRDQNLPSVLGDDIQQAATETAHPAPSAEISATENVPRRTPVRPASKYRPQLRNAAQTPPRDRPNGPSGGQSVMEADFLLSFHPGDWGFDVAALLRRPAGSPEQLEISDGGDAVALASIDELMLEPFPISDLAASLTEGFAAETASGQLVRWVRRGRRLHVFSERSGVPGFATVPRVVIGQENAALCTTDFAQFALEQIIATGSPQPSEIEGPGLPVGWVCWKGIRPAHPHPPADTDELLSALDPLPDAAIEFAGGMTVARGQWIEGHPPSIRIAGTAPEPGDVSIDGVPAVAGADGGWTADGWDAEGVHQVEYRGIRRLYAIVRAEASWPWWAAHRSGIELAGALGSTAGRRPPLIIADSSLWLLGARPGEVSRAVQRPCAPGTYAAPDFDPVWAVARKSGRSRPQPALIGIAMPPQPAPPGTPARSIRAWSKIIRDAGAPNGAHDGVEAAIWRQFVAAARSARRQRR